MILGGQRPPQRNRQQREREPGKRVVQHEMGRAPVGAVPVEREETGGRINYTVNTRDGAVYRCYLYGATGFQKAMSFGQIPHSDAICTARVGSPGRSGQQGPAPSGQPARSGGDGDCNALLRAAGRCGPAAQGAKSP